MGNGNNAMAMDNLDFNFNFGNNNNRNNNRSNSNNNRSNSNNNSNNNNNTFNSPSRLSPASQSSPQSRRRRKKARLVLKPKASNKSRFAKGGKNGKLTPRNVTGGKISTAASPRDMDQRRTNPELEAKRVQATLVRKYATPSQDKIRGELGDIDRSIGDAQEIQAMRDRGNLAAADQTGLIRTKVKERVDKHKELRKRVRWSEASKRYRDKVRDEREKAKKAAGVTCFYSDWSFPLVLV